MKIADMLAAEDVLRLASPDKPRLLHALSGHAAARLGLGHEVVERALADREALGSTGVGHGIALPHARFQGVQRPFGLFAALAKPIGFGAVDDLPVDLVFLLLLPASVAEDQLRCLACAARRFKEPGLVKQLRDATDQSRLYELVTGTGR